MVMVVGAVFQGTAVESYQVVCHGIRPKHYCLSAQLLSVVVQDKAVLDMMKGKGCRLQHAQSDVPYQAAFAVMTNCFGMFVAALLCVVLQSRPWRRDYPP
jgi:hypothetical protein